MQQPQFIPVQFLDASSLNAALDTLFNDDALINSILFTPGVVNPMTVMYSSTGLQVMVDLPSPFAIISSTGILAQAHGTVDNQNSSSYQVDLTPLVPAAGSAAVTAYVIATITSIYQNPFIVTCPPSGHPDYNPNYSPSQQQATLQYSLSVSASTTPPNNTNEFLLGEFTLNPGQATLPAINTTNQLLAAVNVPMAAASST